MKELTPEEEKYLNLNTKGCLPLIFKKPVCLEPPYSGTYLERYDRDTKEILVLKVYSSPLDEVTSETSELFLNSLRGISEPASFELIGSGSRLTLQFVVQKRDRSIVESALRSLFKNAYLKDSKDVLLTHYAMISRGSDLNAMEFQFNDYYLAPPFYSPLIPLSKDFTGDALDALYPIFSQLRPEDLSLYQVIFIPAKSDWAKLARTLIGIRDEDTRLVMVKDYNNYSEWLGDYRKKIETRPKGREYHPYLSDPELKFHTMQALEKIKYRKPFFAVSLRIGLFTHKGKAFGILPFVP